MHCRDTSVILKAGTCVSRVPYKPTYQKKKHETQTSKTSTLLLTIMYFECILCQNGTNNEITRTRHENHG